MKTLLRLLISHFGQVYLSSFSDNVESLCEATAMPRCSFLRAFCQTVGIQIALRDYQFDSKHRQTFTEDDILNLYPIVKHLHPKVRERERGTVFALLTLNAKVFALFSAGDGCVPLPFHGPSQDRSGTFERGPGVGQRSAEFAQQCVRPVAPRHSGLQPLAGAPRLRHGR